MNYDSTLRQIARRRLGVLPRTVMLEAGLSAAAVARRVDSGLLHRVLPGVYMLDGFPRTIEARALAAIEWAGPGSVASHRCCARLFRMDDAPGLIELTTPRKLTRVPSGMVVHRRRPDVRDMTTIGVVPITTPTRLLLDAGSVVGEELLETWLDQALREGRTSVSRLSEALSRSHRMRGVAALRKLLQDRDPNAAPNESRLETVLARLLRTAGLHDVRPQRVLYDDGGYIGRIDFVFPQRRLIVEAHSYKYHSSRRAWEADVERWNRLRRSGWRVVLLTWRKVLTEPEAVIAEIRAELADERLPV